ncbi:hypothetical protein D3C73_1349580 [compost metagenome]
MLQVVVKPASIDLILSFIETDDQRELGSLRLTICKSLPLNHFPLKININIRGTNSGVLYIVRQPGNNALYIEFSIHN